MFYLIHELFVEWVENDFVQIMIKKQDMNYKLAVFLAFMIFTPVLVLVSWLLLILVDDPFKDFAYEVDIVSRKNRPPAKAKAGGAEAGAAKGSDGDDDEF
jgi:peptidoglycan/LPS O-acetylase OafA/YrhL